VWLRYHVDQSYSDEAVVTDRFSVVFSREEQESPGTYTGLRLPDGGLSFSKQYGDYEYKIWARTNWFPRDQDARKLLASAETLRDDGLARFDELERWTEEQLETGELVRWVVDHGKTEEVADGDTGLEIPQDLTLHPPFPHEYQLSNQQKQDILSDARAELDRRRNLLRENYRELYSAAHAAFPLHESLTEP
jgi:hypothetical protein